MTNKINEAEENYNASHKMTRSITEYVIGALKRRFPCLWIDSRLCYKLTTMQAIVIAVCMLHNISIMHNDGSIGEDDDIPEIVNFHNL